MEGAALKSVPVLHTVFSTIIALFLLRVLQHIVSGRTNSLAQGVEGGLSYLLGS